MNQNPYRETHRPQTQAWGNERPAEVLAGELEVLSFRRRRYQELYDLAFAKLIDQSYLSIVDGRRDMAKTIAESATELADAAYAEWLPRQLASDAVAKEIFEERDRAERAEGERAHAAAAARAGEAGR